MLERHMNNPIYQPQPKTKKFNNALVVKLTKCYRMHPTLLKLPNEMYYNNEMVACTDKMILSLNLAFLPSPNFPMMFEDICGETLREEHGFR